MTTQEMIAALEPLALAAGQRTPKTSHSMQAEAGLFKVLDDLRSYELQPAVIEARKQAGTKTKVTPLK